jgi:hypothetical protein
LIDQSREQRLCKESNATPPAPRRNESERAKHATLATMLLPRGTPRFCLPIEPGVLTIGCERSTSTHRCAHTSRKCLPPVAGGVAGGDGGCIALITCDQAACWASLASCACLACNAAACLLFVSGRFLCSALRNQRRKLSQKGGAGTARRPADPHPHARHRNLPLLRPRYNSKQSSPPGPFGLAKTLKDHQLALRT